MRLREAGVGSDTPVPLLTECSIDAVVGILAILKAGGAYVPINPRDPDERIAAMGSRCWRSATMGPPVARWKTRPASSRT